MANAGYILVKGDNDKTRKMGVQAFYGPEDKGSAKPSFCYPTLKDSLKEEIRSLERALEDKHVGETRVMKVKKDVLTKKAKLDRINQQEADAMKLFKDNKDAIMARRDELAEIISAGMPKANDITKKRYNPHRIYEDEKKKGLGALKKEYQILSKLAGEESNVKFLQRD